MPDNYEMSIWEKIRVIQEWSPIVSYIQSLLSATDPHDKALVVADACEWMAAKSKTQVDDELVGHLSAVLRSPQGEAFLRWVLEKIDGADKAP